MKEASRIKVENESPPAFAHGKIAEIFPNIFLVTGTSIYNHNGQEIQKSNNMVIVRDGNDLILINTLRLNENGLNSLAALGKIAHVIRLGAFHDRNDQFYLEKYQAKLWAINGMQHKGNHIADFEITTNVPGPFPDSSFFVFATTSHPEGVLLIEREGGILLTCDSIKNWTKVDEYFSEKTGQEFLAQGLIAPANIDKDWLTAMKPSKVDLINLAKLEFKHLISAHGEPILDFAGDLIKPKLKALAKSKR